MTSLTRNWFKRTFSIMPEHNDRIARETLEELRHIRREIKELKDKMIAQSAFDASLANATSTITAAIAALATSNTATSTPDTVVQAYMAGMDAQVVTLAAATPPVVAPPALAVAK